MFDFRYHALSLVAVFLALVVGLLLGVAIGDQGLVSSAERDIRNSLRGDVRDARAESDRLRAELDTEKQLEQQLYPLTVGGRLPGQRVGIVAMGGVDDSVVNDVRTALAPTGGRLVSVAVIRAPPDLNGLGSDLKSTRFATVATDDALAGRLGRRIGVDLVQGGKVVRQVRRRLFRPLSGTLNGLTGVVLVRPDQKLDGAQGTATNAFEDGLVEGMKRTDVPLVGVEQTSTNPSTIKWFEDHQISSVDNVDQLTGRTSTVFVLAGANGSFGIKDTADAVLPDAVPAQ